MTKKKRAERKKQLIWGAVGVVAIILLMVVAGYSTELRTQIANSPSSSLAPLESQITENELTSAVAKCKLENPYKPTVNCQDLASILDKWCRTVGAECLTATLSCLPWNDDEGAIIHGINYVKVVEDGKEVWCLVDIGAFRIDCHESINPGTPDKPDGPLDPATMDAVCALMTLPGYGAKPNYETNQIGDCFCQQTELTDFHLPPYGQTSSCAQHYDDRATQNGYSGYTQNDVGRACIKCCGLTSASRNLDGKWAAACVDACHNTFPALNISPDVCAADKSLTSQLACHQCCDRQVSSPEKGSGQWVTECRQSCDQAHPLPTTGFLSPLQSTLKNIFP